MNCNNLSISVAEAARVFREYLHEEGLRCTEQRLDVLRAAWAAAGHFSAGELHAMLGAEVSRATVYRTLDCLVRAGLLREVLQGRERTYYEPCARRGHHDHMLCVACGKVIEFCDERIERLQDAMCREKGFRPIDHRMGIRGVCRECRGKEDAQ
jgi:Fur family ferric uptake transcriptional regulator